MALCSIGIAAGIIGCVALLALVKRAFFRRRCGHGHGRHRHGGPGRSWWLRALFSRLDTTPGQEREIRAAIEEVQRVAREAKEGVFTSRENLAKAIAGDVFDVAQVDDAQLKVDAAAVRVKDAFRAALEKVHAVLDARQRERLAELLAKGAGHGTFGGWGSPYRRAF